MRIYTRALMLTAFLASTASLAQTEGRSEAQAGGGGKESSFTSPFSVRPHAGVLAFKDASGEETGRALGGFIAELNGSDAFKNTLGDIGVTPQVGFQTGLLYSHLGAVGSDAFGASSPGGPGADANTYQVPMNIVLGGSFAQNRALATIHTGANLIVRSDPNSMQLGRANNPDGTTADFFPNLGGDLGYSLGRNVGLVLRGDYTFTPDDDIFTGTLGAVISLG